MTESKKYDTGLILSGGAARGFAHIGILKALEEWDIFPEVISGVSAGSIVGVLYCDGYSPDEILEIFNRKKLFEFVRIGAFNTGFLEMNGLRESLERNLRSRQFSELKKPLWVTLTNYSTGRTEYLNEGKLIDAIIASCSIPVLFKPQQIGDDYYIDGGITNNFPVEPIAASCKQLIGAYVNPVGKIKVPKGVFNMALRSFHLSIASAIRDKEKKMALFIEPLDIQDYGLFEIAKGKEMYDIGYREARNVLQKTYGSKKSA